MQARKGRRQSLGCWVALVVGGLLVSGCADERPTAIMVAVATDLEVPGELDAFSLLVEHRARSVHQQVYSLDDSQTGAVALPATIAIAPGGDHSGPVKVTVAGRLDSTDRLTRRARLSFVAGRVVLLQMSLLRECADGRRSCAVGDTCLAGGCGSIDVSAEALPDYGPERVGLLADGGSVADGPSPTDSGPADGGARDQAAVDAVVDAARLPDASTRDPPLGDATADFGPGGTVELSLSQSGLVCPATYYSVGGAVNCSHTPISASHPEITPQGWAADCVGPTPTVVARCAGGALGAAIRRRLSGPRVWSRGSTSVECPAGRPALVGGGCRCSAGALTHSYPLNGNRWHCTCEDVGAELTVHALCVTDAEAQHYGVEIVDNTSSAAASIQEDHCPAGKVVLGGGCRIVYGTVFGLQASAPTRVEADGLNGWGCEYAGLVGSLKVYAVCANGP